LLRQFWHTNDFDIQIWLFWQIHLFWSKLDFAPLGHTLHPPFQTTNPEPQTHLLPFITWLFPQLPIGTQLWLTCLYPTIHTQADWLLLGKEKGGQSKQINNLRLNTLCAPHIQYVWSKLDCEPIGHFVQLSFNNA
jgi:hypothetical protein